MSEQEILAKIAILEKNIGLLKILLDVIREEGESKCGVTC